MKLLENHEISVEQTIWIMSLRMVMSKHTEKCYGSAAVIFLSVGNFKKKKREKHRFSYLTY